MLVLIRKRNQQIAVGDNVFVTVLSVEPHRVRLGIEARKETPVLGYRSTEYVNSCGLALVLVWHKRFRDAGGELGFHSIPSPVMETLRILRMELVLRVSRDVTSALEIVRGEAT